MSTSSPADLAVAFRSLARRLEEASVDAPANAIATTRAAVDASLARTAGVLGCATSADAIAAALVARRSQDWSEADLATVQADAIAAAAAIRTLATMAPER